ncbi:MAG TPA: flagellar biosynthetic protein FliR [Hyphomicrobiales bacterium]|nr:flagellar biosynthetic protein FliR [Hyphomicrobiales bacterium]
MSLSEDQLLAWLAAVLLPFIRFGAFFLAVPFYGAQSVPVRIRILLALIVAMLLSPQLPAPGAVSPLSVAGLLAITQQVAVGIGMGLVLQFTWAAVLMAGHLMATTMGLGFASSADPQNGVPVTLVGQFYLILATLFFLGMHGHLLLLQVLAASFTRFPLDGFVLDAGFFASVLTYSAQLFVTGLLLALPVLTGVLLVNLAFGVMTRAAPQLNIFSMGFPLTILAGFCLMLLTLPALTPVLADVFADAFATLDALAAP